MKNKNSARFTAGLGEHHEKEWICSQQVDEDFRGAFIYATALSTLSGKKPLEAYNPHKWLSWPPQVMEREPAVLNKELDPPPYYP